MERVHFTGAYCPLVASKLTLMAALRLLHLSSSFHRMKTSCGLYSSLKMSSRPQRPESVRWRQKHSGEGREEEECEAWACRRNKKLAKKLHATCFAVQKHKPPLDLEMSNSDKTLIWPFCEHFPCLHRLLSCWRYSRWVCPSCHCVNTDSFTRGQICF